MYIAVLFYLARFHYILDMVERKPILGHYQFSFYFKLEPAALACDRLNRSREESKQDPLYIWPREYTDNRGRDYIVEEPRVFWGKYKGMRPNQRTFYEIIRTGDPCRFYLDLEFSRVLNPNLDGETKMEIVRQYVKDIFLCKLGIVLEHYSVAQRREQNILSGMMFELDASNAVKFSRHLVVVLSSVVFFAT